MIKKKNQKKKIINQEKMQKARRVLKRKAHLKKNTKKIKKK